MLRFVASALLILLAGGAAPPPPPRAQEPIEVQIARGADGHWSADFDFHRTAGAWVFLRPASTLPPGPPLSERWRVETPGVTLSRRGAFDMLTADDGSIPERVRIAMGPWTARTGAPFAGLEFSDGALVFYTGQFILLARGSAAEAEALPALVVGRGFPRDALPPIALTLKDPERPILWRGISLIGEASGLTGRGGYAVFGRARSRTIGGVATLEDRNLPPWLIRQIETFLPRLLDFYGQGLGERSADAPTIAMAWAGSQPREAGFEGRVAPGAVSLRFAGDGLVRPRGTEFANARRFLAHEVAHFWLGQTAIPKRPAEAWTYEGGAETLASLAMAAITPGFDPRLMLQGELDRCLELSRGRPFARALAPAPGGRGPYACGAMLALAAEAAVAKAHPGAPPLAFHRALMARARGQGGLFDQESWLQVLDEAAGSAEVSAQARALVLGAESEAGPRLAKLFTAAGLPYRLDDRGRIRLEKTPRALFSQAALRS